MSSPRESPFSQQSQSQSQYVEPSPALSAYSYTSSSSSESDYDLNSLKLDDIDTPTSTYRKGAYNSQSSRNFYSLLNAGATRALASGTATPVPGSLSRASTGNVQRYLQEREHDNEEELDKELDEQEDEVENEPDGFDVEDEDEEDMHANGVPAARGWRLDARKAETPAFQEQVLRMFSQQLEIQSWSDATVDQRLTPLQANCVQLKRISGAFSNAVFFVSYKVPESSDGQVVGPKTVLLRVYGTGTEALLSRRAELLILHTLSSLYEIGPHILGTFANGRVETFFDAEPIGKDGIRDLGDRRETIKEDGSLLVRGSEGRAQWVARRMRQLHEVPLETMRTVLEQGDLRSNGSDRGSVFGQGIENHLFARSHRPRMQSRPMIDSSRLMRESPAPMAEDSETGILATAADGARSEAMAIRGSSPHRNGSVASFDSLATSYNSQDDSSVASMSNENLLSSPAVGPTSAFSSYVDNVHAARINRMSTGPGSSPLLSRSRKSSFSHRQNSSGIQPYPGMWRRSKRWAREAAKVLALVDEFSKTSAGQAACQRALQGTPLESQGSFSPFSQFDPSLRVPSLDLGTTVYSLQKTLLAIASIDFPRLLEEMDAFKKFIRRWERKHGSSRRVLAHGDTQYSNLLLIKEGALVEENAGKGMPRGSSRENSIAADGKHDDQSSVSSSMSRSRPRRLAPYERLIVIDFEYCSPNPRAYDIANAFHEWRFDYHHPVDCWSPYQFAYPTREERRRWLRAYVEQGRHIRMRGKAPKSADPLGHATTTSTPSPTPSEALPNPSNFPPLDLPPSVLQRDSSDSNSTPTKAPVSKENRDEAAKRQSQRRSRSSSVQQQSQAPGQPSPGFGPLSGALSSPAVRAALEGDVASPMLSGRTSLAYLEASMEREIERLEREVEVFSPACHINWALWGMTFAKEAIEALLLAALEGTDLEKENAAKERQLVAGSAESFDNLRYAMSRIELFRKEIAHLKITPSP